MRFVQAAPREALDAAERALSLAAELGLEEPPRALGARGGARCDLGDAGGLEEMRRALELSIEHGRGRDAAMLHNNLSETLSQFEGPAAALTAFHAGIDFCERRGIAELAIFTAAESLMVLVQLGEWDQALALAGSLAPRAEASGATVVLHKARSAQTRLLAHRGKAEQATAQVDWLVATARETRRVELIANTFAAATLAWLASGDREQAAALLSELEQTPNMRGTPYSALLPELVRAALACSEPALAALLVDGVESLTPQHEHALCAARAALAEAAGEHEQAAELYAEAAERWQRFGDVPERAHALLGRGRCLLALGRPGAEPLLHEARELFAGLGAQPLVAETGSLLERAPGADSA